MLAKLLLRLIYQNILKGWNINTFPEERENDANKNIKRKSLPE